MFTFVENYEFDWPVTVQYPGANGDIEASFTARFKLVEEDELFARIEDADKKTARDFIDLNRAQLLDRVTGWDGIETENGDPVPFSKGMLETLLKQRPIRMALSDAYYRAVVEGGIETKN